MLDNFKGWLGPRGRGDSHEDRQRQAQEFAEAAKKAKRLDSPRNAAILAEYVQGMGKDYDDVPSSFYYPALGTKFHDIEKEMIALSLEPRNRDRRIYMHTGAELWTALNGAIAKRQLTSEYA